MDYSIAAETWEFLDEHSILCTQDLDHCLNDNESYLFSICPTESVAIAMGALIDSCCSGDREWICQAVVHYLIAMATMYEKRRDLEKSREYNYEAMMLLDDTVNPEAKKLPPQINAVVRHIFGQQCLCSGEHIYGYGGNFYPDSKDAADVLAWVWKNLPAARKELKATVSVLSSAVYFWLRKRLSEETLFQDLDQTIFRPST